MVNTKIKATNCLIILIVLILVSCAADRPQPYVVKTLTIENKKSASELSELTLGPGDKIAISVWRNTELDRSVTIDPSGKINLPLSGEIKVSGMTITDLRNKITERLTKFIKSPVVSINTISIASQKIHVLGEVQSPGTLVFMERMAIWEAVSAAGGFTNNANTKRLLLLRVTGREASISVVPLDFEKIFKDGVLEGDYYLKSGDVLYVAEKKIASAEKFMTRINNIITPIYTIERMITMWPNLKDALEGDRSNITVTP